MNSLLTLALQFGWHAGVKMFAGFSASVTVKERQLCCNPTRFVSIPTVQSCCSELGLPAGFTGRRPGTANGTMEILNCAAQELIAE